MNIASFGNFFGPDTLIIFLVILLLFGAKKLPELARGMGQAVREFGKAKDEIEREVTRPPATETPKALYEPKSDLAGDPAHHDEHADMPHDEYGNPIHDEHHKSPAESAPQDQTRVS
jgi:sec-independent protein translocase protein TatA